MAEWLAFSLVAVVFWGIVGLLQKVTTNHISADAVLIWDRIGSVVLLPVLLLNTPLTHFATKDMLVGTLAGLTNSLGALYLYMSLQSGAKASIAVPLTALYPLVTALLAVVFLGEKVSTSHWVGVALAIVASVLMSIEGPVVRKKSRLPSSASPFTPQSSPAGTHDEDLPKST